MLYVTSKVIMVARLSPAERWFQSARPQLLQNNILPSNRSHVL